MSAVLRPAPSFEPMSEADLRRVLEIEENLYEFPWTLGNFRDSLRAGYDCWVVRDGKQLIGYAVLMLAAGEAHLLNLSVAAHAQRRGHGRTLLNDVVGVARERDAKVLFLEVRPTNEGGQRLYTRYGFRQIGVAIWKRWGSLPCGSCADAARFDPTFLRRRFRQARFRLRGP